MRFARPSVAVWIGGFSRAARSDSNAFDTGIRARGTDLVENAWLSFLLNWPTYAADCSDRLARLSNGCRKFGLALASALLVHLTLIAWLTVVGAAKLLGGLFG
jgi:hypothetical protein